MGNSTFEQKKNYLDILAVFHYVNGGLHLLIALAAVGFLGIGLGAATEWGENWQAEAGCSLIAVMAMVFVLLGGYGALNLLAGRALHTRSNYVLAMLASAVNCLNLPLGTLLGIFTLVTLSDPQVKNLFEPAEPSAIDRGDDL
jgi:amino acid transporter